MAPKSFELTVNGAKIALGEQMRLVIAGRASSLLVAYLAGTKNGEDRVLIAGADPADEGVAIHRAWSWPTSCELQVTMAAEPLNTTLNPADTAALGELMSGKRGNSAGIDVIQNAIVIPDRLPPTPDPYYLGSEYHHVRPLIPARPQTFMGQQIIPLQTQHAVL